LRLWLKTGIDPAWLILSASCRPTIKPSSSQDGESESNPIKLHPRNDIGLTSTSRGCAIAMFCRSTLRWNPDNNLVSPENQPELSAIAHVALSRPRDPLRRSKSILF
jgi:hypothetical protein